MSTGAAFRANTAGYVPSACSRGMSFQVPSFAGPSLPLLARSRGAIVNILSLAAIACVPFSPAYSISKAAALSLTQGLRALLAGRGVSVHAALVGPVDTDMTRELEIPKSPPESVAKGILDGLERGEEEIFPDVMSEPLAEGWRNGMPKALERQFAAYVAGPDKPQ
jgi:short-subunit dehydrogenase